MRRSFGTEISGNRRPRGELSPAARALVISKLEDRLSQQKIAIDLGISRGAV
ncbi:hypothetical protein P154DRAFT_167655 [Amniculicola lignicola CBS 123094]|uniref:HTH psq-type domain-containing protein n=1 Tax=Amniculicola lignicola CBS 123094 TaxID=1392246 RepID=A0A6A5VXW2_9PLEO|nr:hypothetical protein P154DRAFT_167655 [Amniculicola lignicola CBS 123094]